jgi:hypothetical protein
MTMKCNSARGIWTESAIFNAKCEIDKALGTSKNELVARLSCRGGADLSPRPVL